MAIAVTTLAEQEAIVEENLHSFVQLGNALMTIRDEELYREAGFDGFVAYLESKPWGISPRGAYERIDTAKVCAITQTSESPLNQEQAKVLAPLARQATPEVVKQVYEEAVEEAEAEGEKVTAKRLKEKVKEVLPARKKKVKETTNGVKPTAASLIGQAAFATSLARGAVRLFKKVPQDELPELIAHAESAVVQWGVIIETLQALREEGS